ncbi:uncharacterized protein LOC107429568 [Ziziphus jujuba]|uniref:Uncharacterized protein LOC107429568 n=2 Tax=Ziziphus jujuba TaxID=326968 RepID=A0A6P6GJX9_ZIZJJ|nr:uncharacterized protein LOC107429568 [Ziziphus jujuba]KAH7516618.1 hypothetical protein FEM48_Zijuj10G0154100 [Ziziphus jujuba var. spinosa]
MEDINMLGADCMVISCCGQCLILQILVLVFLQLPYKMVRKTKNYTKKKLHRHRGRKKQEKTMSENNKEMDGLENEFVAGVIGGSMRRRIEGEEHCGCCMEEVEKVLEELSLKGEFAFGSFWGRGESGLIFPTPLDKHEFDYDSFVQYNLIDMLGSFN